MTGAGTKPDIKIYNKPWDGTRGAYDDTQSNDTQSNERVSDGDILVVPRERVVGFLFRAWPIAITPEHGEFHSTTDGGRFDGEQWSDYRNTIETARRIAVRLGYAHEQY